MLSNYLYIHLPLNTTTLPTVSLNADTAPREATPIHLSNKQQPVSMVTGAGTSTGSEDSPALTTVTASSDRRHFWTDNMSAHRGFSLDPDVRTGPTSYSAEKKPNPLSLSTHTTLSFLSSTPPPLSDMFDSIPSSHPSSPTSSIFSTPPTTPVAVPTTPKAVPTSSLTKLATNKKQAANGLISYIKNLLWQFYWFLLTLFKASFVPVSGRMITLLAKEQETRSPLSNALLCFVTKVTSKTMDKPWLCNERLQLGMLSLFGKQLDR